MRTGSLLLITIAALSFVAPNVSAQACGDVNNDGIINITDLVLTFGHINRTI